MAHIVFLRASAADLTAGKPPLRGVPASAPLSAAAAAIPASQEADVAVWRDGASPLAPAAATVIGLISSFDVVAFLASHVGAEDARRRRGGAPAGARAGGRAPHEVMRATFWNFASCFVLDLIHAISCLNGSPCARSSSPHRISTEWRSFCRLSIVHSSIIEALCIQISDTHV